MARPLLVAWLVSAWLAIAMPAPTLAAQITFESPTLEVTIRRLQGFIDFTSDKAPTKVELMSRTGPREPWFVLEAELAGGNGRYTAAIWWSLRRLPNTPFQYRFRVTTADGQVMSDQQQVTVVDNRFDWQTMSGPLVRLHWYQGNEAFARRALAVAEKAIADASSLLGVQETEPIDFFVYASDSAFREALGPGTPENAAGQANPSIRTLFALIQPSQINSSWVPTVITHELTHLVFDTATNNPYHEPPRWLNEGLAVYRSEGYGEADRTRVANAKSRNAIIPLDGLTVAFPPRDKFLLSYAESASAVDFFIRKYGQPTLVKLVRSYASGVSDDEAFMAATGADVKAFNAAWLADLGVRPPQAVGPRPAPTGPLPAGWTATAPGSFATAQPGAPGEAPPTPAPATSTPSGDGLAPVAALIVLLVALGIAGLAAMRYRTRPPGSLPEPPASPPASAPPSS